MLTDLSELQESGETVVGTPYMSFEIETHSDESGELIRRRYTFNYAKEWDKWTFAEFEEKRTTNTERVSGRNWRTEKNVAWEDPKAADVVIPKEVTDQLNDLVGMEKIVLQPP